MSVPLFHVCVLAALLLVSKTDGANSIDVDACREKGFDPLQLSCSTCDLLPESVTYKCKSCCLPYKTLEKRTHRYQAAVLIDSKMSQEIDTLIKEDWEDIVAKKGNRISVKTVPGGGMFYSSPSILFWFDQIPSSALDVEELQELAKETIFLDGWKRDDMRDMLLALLMEV